MNNKGIMEQKNKLIPELRFPEFVNDGDWVIKKLQSLTNTTIGEFVIKTKQNPNSAYPVYNGGKSYTGFYDEYNNDANKIVISARGANAGFVNLVKQKYWAGNSCYSVEVIEQNKIDLELLFYYIKHNQKRFTDNQQAANIPSVSKADVEKFEICYPKFILEQKKIADCLSSLDELITAHNDKLETLKSHKKGLLQNLFPQEGQKVPNYRFPEFVNDGEWESKTVKDVAYYENGKAHEQDILDNGKYKVVNSKFISTEGKVVKYSNKAHCLAEKNDVLMVLSDVPNGRAIAKCFFVNENNLYTVNQRVCKLKSFDINSKFLYILLNRNKYFLAFDDGVKQTNLKNDDVLNCPILLPKKTKDNKEQQKIADCLMAVDNLIAAQTEKIEQLKTHKKGLMQGLFPKIEE
jgi:type I restriction enzyme S subunit